MGADGTGDSGGHGGRAGPGGRSADARGPRPAPVALSQFAGGLWPPLIQLTTRAGGVIALRPDHVVKYIEGTDAGTRGSTAIWLSDGHFEVVRDKPLDIGRMVEEARQTLLDDLLTLCQGEWEEEGEVEDGE